MGSYVEWALIEKLHARITEVSPANPGETLNDAVERLIAERDAAREEAAELREQVLRLRDACESVAQNMEVSGQLWSSWHTSIAIARLRDALNMTASDNSIHVAP